MAILMDNERMLFIVRAVSRYFPSDVVLILLRLARALENSVLLAITKFFDKFLTNSRSQRGLLPDGKAFVVLKPEYATTHKLVYQDGATSAKAHAYADVYLSPSGSYLVVGRCAPGPWFSDSYQRVKGQDAIEEATCTDLCEVFDLLAWCPCRDQNSCGALLVSLTETIKDRKRGGRGAVAYREKGYRPHGGHKYKTKVPLLAASRGSLDFAAAIERYVSETEPYRPRDGVNT